MKYSYDNLTVFWNIMPCSLIDVYQRFGEICFLHLNLNLKMEAAGDAEILVNIYSNTRRNILEDTNLHSHGCHNLKSHEMW
jgi:hypothetical protein